MWRNADKIFSKCGFSALCLGHRNHFWPELDAGKNRFGRVNVYCCQNFTQRCKEILMIMLHRTWKFGILCQQSFVSRDVRMITFMLHRTWKKEREIFDHIMMLHRTMKNWEFFGNIIMLHRTWKSTIFFGKKIILHRTWKFSHMIVKKYFGMFPHFHFHFPLF